ncbi:2-dehydropantoate 2-reductase [Inquilinus limosus]|uniref:2-dehydropantoate 2-reductase n=1 Tax=Inquilinus limosus TaxID=171674 RepID=UPI003F148705
MVAPALRICIWGAGLIGCYLGGRLQAGGGAVTFIARSAQAPDQGLELTDLHGHAWRVPADSIRWAADGAAAATADLILLTVKADAVEAACREILAFARPQAVVVGLQNGVAPAQILRRSLAGRIALAGVVPFNVVRRGPGRLHQASAGRLAIERHPALAPALPLFRRAGLPLDLRDDIAAVQWAKLLLNLNNAVNALSGLPLREELLRRGYRRCTAMAQREALSLLSAAGIRPARITPLPPGWIPPLLELSTPLFRLLAARLLRIDPLARSSMLEDLEAGRPTEVDWLNGEITRLADHLGRKAPINARLVELVRAAEHGESRRIVAEDLLRELESAAG